MNKSLAHCGVAFAMLALSACSTQPSSEPATDASAQPSTTQAASAQPAREAPRAAASAQVARDAKTIPGQRSIYYEYDKSDLTREGRALIEAHARYLREHPELKVRIEGNADERGSAEYNVALGQRRAEGVSKTMTLLGIPDSRIEAVSFGKEKPKARGHDEGSWSENRRSDIMY